MVEFTEVENSFSLWEWLGLVISGWTSRVEKFFSMRATEPLRAAESSELAEKVWQTSHTSDTPAKHHTWMQIMVFPVEVVPDPDDGEPVLFIDKAEIYRLANEDPRVGCLTCSMSLDEGWDTPCEGVNHGSENVPSL